MPVVENHGRSIRKSDVPVIKFDGFVNKVLGGLQEKIFRDRYAAKTISPEQWELGTMVVTMLAEDPLQPLFRKTITAELVDVDLEKRIAVVKDRATGELHTVKTGDVEYSGEQEIAGLWHRVAHALASVEKDSKVNEVYHDFASVLNDFKLVPGGRVMAGAGTEELSLMNCFVIPQPHDSRRGIMNSVADMVDIMARGGGVGVNISSLRPKRALVHGVNGHSSGSVSWGGLYSYVTGLVEQGGSRRGALMLMIHDWHPDVLHFIRAKSQMGVITNANMSVCISNAFMKAVKEDLDWVLEFPDTKHPAYDTEWHGNLKDWKKKGYPTEVHQTIKAREIWSEIITSAWKSAEPGVVFMEYVNDMANSWYYLDIDCTNPCGEQPIPWWSVCNLSAINLSKFFDEYTKDVEWDELARVVRIAVRFCDNVTEYTTYPLEDQVQQQVFDERRSGLGTMGVAELMIRMELRYGSGEGNEFLDKLYSFIAHHAYLASADLAEEKGSFGKFNVDYFLQSGFMRNLIDRFPDIEAAIREKGIRNVCILTQAPTGSTGTMAGTSTGVEPYFAFSYVRSGRLGDHQEYVPIADEWMKAHPEADKLPDWFVTAQDLKARDHVRVQAVIQKWTDSAISKTANAPHDFTVEETARLYELAFDLGCKGVTIYRDGSRDIQVLSTKKEEPKEAPKGLEKSEVTKSEDDFESSKVCQISYDDQGNRVVECTTE